MAEKVATRNAYGQALAELGSKYPEVLCFDADLAGATMSKFFKDAHPDRFFDMGIAEADMQGVAAGLATCGFKPFTNTFAMFAAGRSWEQVRQLHRLPRPECQGGRLPRRPQRRRGRRHPSVHRGLRHHAGHPRYDGPLPLRRL